MTERDRLAALQAENERLAALLDSHGIQWRQPPSPQPGVREPESTNLSTDEKVAPTPRQLAIPDSEYLHGRI